jgi:hypothetical protein
LARREPLPKDLPFDDAECALDSEDQLVIEIIQVVDLLLVGDERPKSRLSAGIRECSQIQAIQ